MRCVACVKLECVLFLLRAEFWTLREQFSWRKLRAVRAYEAENLALYFDSAKLVSLTGHTVAPLIRRENVHKTDSGQ